MKYVSSFLMLMLIFLFSASAAMALDSLSSDGMENVTGQAGVQIAVDDVKMYMNTEELWYTDTDGIAGQSGDGASVGIEGLTANIQVNMLEGTSTTPTSPGDTGLQGDYSENEFAFSDAGYMESSPMAIDVTSQLKTLQFWKGIKIELPTVEIYQDSLSIPISVMDSDSPMDSPGSVNSFGEVNMGGATMAIFNGYAEISPVPVYGQDQYPIEGDAVTHLVDDVKMYTHIDGVWYTDTDGISGDDGASVGLTELASNVQVNSLVNIAGWQSMGDVGLQGDYSGLDEEMVGDFMLQPIVMQASDSLPLLGDAGLSISVPGVEIYMSSFKTTLGVKDTTNPVDGGNLSEFGDISVGETTMSTFGGKAEIAPH